MLETSVLSIGVIKNDSIFKSGRQSKYFFLENLMEEWTSLLTVIAAGKVWLVLFEDIIFFILYGRWSDIEPVLEIILGKFILEKYLLMFWSYLLPY